MVGSQLTPISGDKIYSSNFSSKSVRNCVCYFQRFFMSSVCYDYCLLYLVFAMYDIS